MKMKMTLLPIILLLTLSILVSGDEHPELRDKALRYTGFRFELPVVQKGFDIKSLIQSRAETNFCFGWVQDSPRGSIVGEARCKKAPGKQMFDFISALGAEESNILFYEDSLIRLHPSSFKIMPPGRNTCFREEPHKCSHLYFQGEDGTAFHER